MSHYRTVSGKKKYASSPEQVSEYNRRARAKLSVEQKREMRKRYASTKKLKTDEIVQVIRAHKTRPCADCKQSYPYYVMQFDHVSGVKLFDLAHGKKRGLPSVLAEIAKCEVVCANCHAERTHSRGVPPVPSVPYPVGQTNP